MKVLKIFVGIACMAGVMLFGLKIYTQHSHSEMAGVMDQLNPLVTRGEVYVKTTKPEEVNSYGTAKYVQTAADSDGNERTIEYNGISVLKENCYLKITNKGAHIETYEEIDKQAVPEKALEIIV
ncbi:MULTISPECIES: YxeA family protein [Enterococcus]|uniref:YxeA family protein n=1 Tax=Enterococcus TaxID=1350 RepID=UPI000CF0667C|nr:MULTISPECIES: YxeA family protein [Enterococcus]PQD40469.1 hypothetical protein CUM72_03190 [Enterococcus durans]TKN16924.1 YxeA family protein [Enterococcus sp. VV15]